MSLVKECKQLDLFILFETFFFESGLEEICRFIVSAKNKKIFLKLRENHVRYNINYNMWLDDYHETSFFQLFRMQKYSFYKLLDVMMSSGYGHLIRKRNQGGNRPVEPEKGLLVFLWYLSKQDTLLSIAEHFNLVPSTVMNLVNIFLYVVLQLKNKYIVWPKTNEDFEHISAGFQKYPSKSIMR